MQKTRLIAGNPLELLILKSIFNCHKRIFKSEARKGKLERFKKLIDWAISSQASNHQEPCVLMYDEGSTTILYGVESSDSKCRGSQRNLRECDIVWSAVKIAAADEVVSGDTSSEVS